MAKPLEIQLLETPQGILLDHHAVIEAHAGTGKTYTIVQTVLRILELPSANSRIHIREILLVTFTDKAAGELKKRIREGLEERIAELQKDPALHASLILHLSECLNTLHEALIGTIHGVCLRLLQAWPFETGVPFNTNMVNDGEGLQSTLRESIRTDWQNQETQIPWALGVLQQRGIALGQKEFDWVCELAKATLDRQNTVLDRRACKGFELAGLRALLSEVNAILANAKIRKEWNAQILSLADLLSEVEKSPVLDEERREQISARCVQLRDMVKTGAYDWALLQEPLKASGRGLLYTAAHAKKIPCAGKIANLVEEIQTSPYLEKGILQGQLLGYLPLVLCCDAALLLRDRWEQTKQASGLISFQDMLRLMHKAVLHSPVFCAALRGRLRYAIIDEFQDTSVLQWQIFERLFLKRQSALDPYLMIVGDPKQSIYSFQGADVNSYLAAKTAIVAEKGIVYGLVRNFRSTPQAIISYNTILGKQEESEDWFKAEEISYPSVGNGGQVAQSPARKEAPKYELGTQALQVMPLLGSSKARLRQMAKNASRVILSLVGKTISVPKGDKWQELKICPEHFAVIVEGHGLADPFMEEFQRQGIPVVKYKQEGVFQSSMAQDLQALLRAIDQSGGDPAPRLAALLTHFFNRHPKSIDPEQDLAPGSALAKALDRWVPLAAQRRWSLLFRDIVQQTQVNERLIRLVDGERHITDLRQIVDYCIEKLYRENYGLAQLIEHLGQLISGEEKASDDKNVYALSTDRSSVRVLTMHASKGLEFPIVFVVTKGSAKKVFDYLSWIEDGKLHIMPASSYSKKNLEVLFPNGVDSEKQLQQERRRLLYVAMTRPQALLFVPMHLDSLPEDGNWINAKLPSKAPDNDLTPILQTLVQNKKLALFQNAEWPVPKSANPVVLLDHIDSNEALPTELTKATEQLRTNLQSLALPTRISNQTSYTELSKDIEHDRVLGASEELGESEVAPETIEVNLPTALPRGKDTGDALHLVLEHCLGLEDLSWVDPSSAIPFEIEALQRKHLEDNQVLARIDSVEGRELALQAALRMVRYSLHTNYQVAGFGELRLASLAKSDRRAELEFQLALAPDWMHGFMDVVYRIANPNAKHPWTYFVLDWKSNSLPVFDAEHIEKSIHESHYDLQAKVYCHALDQYLQGLLGKAYDPAQNLGGAVYVYLRAFEHADMVPVWVHKANPQSDAEFVQQQVGKKFKRGAT